MSMTVRCRMNDVEPEAGTEATFHDTHKAGHRMPLYGTSVGHIQTTTSSGYGASRMKPHGRPYAA